MKVYTAKRKLILAALSLMTGEIYNEDHPENPTADAEAEYGEERLLEAAKEYVEARS